MNYEDISFTHQERENLTVNEFFLLLACEYGHKEWIQWLCNFDGNINLSMRNFLPFQIAIEENNMEIILYLLKQNSQLIYVLKEYMYDEFLHCRFDKMLILYKNIPSLYDNFTSNELMEIFSSLCETDIQLSYWFCEKFPFIPVYRYSHRLFLNAYLSENIEIIKLLHTMFPDYYYIVIIDDKLQCFDIDYSIKPNKKVEKNTISIEKCYICYEDNADIFTTCKHFYCKNCIQKHYEYNTIFCPYCRKENYEYQLFLII